MEVVDLQNLSFDELAAKLSSRPVDIDITQGVGISIVDQRLDYFVPPGIRCGDEVNEARILLVSAPAAVGKTTFAHELAATCHALLWDLSTTQVGTSTFAGGLVRAFGPAGFAEITDRLSKGEVTVVLDALDEAHVRSGHRGLEEFVTDLAQQVLSSAAGLHIAMFARVETALLTQLILESTGVVVQTATIDYFDEPSARRFIDRRLNAHWKALGKQPAHVRNAKLYKEALDTIFAFIANCFGVDEDAPWSSDSVQRFLGYAPVLQAIADYLALENLQVAIRELNDTPPIPTGAARGAWSFLLQVVSHVIDRERAKVMPAIEDQLAGAAGEAEWGSWQLLYGKDEQIDRVLRRYFRIDLFSDKMPTIPHAVRDAYELALAPSADQHPFLADSRQFANLVFQEYAFAWALTNGSPSVRQEVRQRLSSAEFLAGPLLGRFMLALGDPDLSGVSAVNGRDIGFLYDSLSSGWRRGDEGMLWLMTDEDDGIEGRITGEHEDDDVVFAVDNSPTGIHFCRGLANADIFVTGGVVLGVANLAFALGPDVELVTDLLETPAAEYGILGGPNSFVRVLATTHVNPEHPVQLKLHSRGEFGVSWEPLVHPWYGHKIEPAEWRYPYVDRDSFQDLIRLARQFRRHGREELARKKDLIDNVFVGRNNSERTERLRNLRAFLIEQGVLTETLESKGMYFLDLQRTGLSWGDVRDRQLTDGVAAFLAEFARWRAGLPHG